MLENTTEKEFDSISPVTLSADWSRVARLLLLASLSAVGSVGNVFMISAVMIEDYLRKRGNAFVVNVALADFLVSGLLVPASAVVILAGLKDNLAVCRFQWFLAALCFLVTVLSIAATAAENYLRLCGTVSTYEFLTRARITWIVLIIWLVCAITSGLQFTSHLSLDYCTRKYSGLIHYQATIGVIFVCLPVTVTFWCYIRATFRIKVVRSRPNFKLPATYGWDCALMRTNMYSFMLFVLFWLPFGVVYAIGTFRPIPQHIFYNLAWFAISKSCINSILYCSVNRHFRSAYINLFHYCCCKTTVSFSRRQRPNDGGGGGLRPSGDVRVHIIPGYNIYSSPMRGGRESKRSGSHHHHHGHHQHHNQRANGGRDVYEL